MIIAVVALLAAQAAAAEPFAIEVVDEATGRGVPLVELTTTGAIAHVTDSAGLVAFEEPGLMNQTVYFEVKSHGYEAKKDGFGFPGVRLETKPGGHSQIKVKRINVAERLYRITGQGIYRDSLLLGREAQIEQPAINSQVVGLDSVMTAVYRGRLHWFWGDTTRASYPLGNFSTTGATSLLPEAGGLDPNVGINLSYFAGDDGFVQPVCQMPGDGPTWVGGVAVLPDASGTKRLLCGYSKIKPPMTVYRRGIAIWNDEKDTFESASDFDPEEPLYPLGHPVRGRSEDDKWLYFAAPFPLTRVRANVESYKDTSSYEAYTCLMPGSTLDKPEFDRDAAGKLRYSWRRGTPPVGPQEQAKLIKQGVLKESEALLQLRDAATGKTILAHTGSVEWNPHRGRWTNIILELFGTSVLGEIWYAEADSPVGPWVYAKKIVTHDKYSFYNPRQHAALSPKDGKHIYFEATYTHTFSGNEQRTPRYDYNQIMYRLDLADERTALPVAVYDTLGNGFATDLRLSDESIASRAESDKIAFFALDRPTKDAIAVGETPLFFGLAADTDEPDITIPLYEYLSDAGAPAIYSVRDDLEMTGYTRCPEPVCRVWPSPYARTTK